MNKKNIAKGNLAFKTKKYSDAVHHYTNAIQDGEPIKRIAEFNLDLIKKIIGLEEYKKIDKKAINRADSPPGPSRIKHSQAPKLSIVIPVCNDEEYISRALSSCTTQTLSDIEVICIDDNSSDATAEIVLRHAECDGRVKLHKTNNNVSALQARKLGVELSEASYVIFLDGDDELHNETAECCYKKILETKADIVGYGVTVTGRSGSNFEKSLFPVFDELTGSDIIRNIFPIGEPAQGHIWRYCFKRDLLLKAYEQVPPNLKLHRANDLPISFLALALAESYVSIKRNLYIYNMNNGGSGHVDINYDKFVFYCSGLGALSIIKNGINHYTNISIFRKDRLDFVFETYRSIRLSVIGNIIRYLVESLNPIFREKAIKHLISNISLEDLVLSLALFRPNDYLIFNEFLETPSGNKSKKTNKNILLVANNLDTGGLQGVLTAQAIYLSESGHNVKIFLYSGKSSTKHKLPKGVEIIQSNKGQSKSLGAKGDNLRKIFSFLELIKKEEIDVLIDHGILYRNDWLYYTLLAKTQGTKVIGWLHSFALRAIHSRYKHVHFLNENIKFLDTVVTLSETDATYWKLLGHERVYYLPNPPSPMLIEHAQASKVDFPPPNISGNIKLLWYGRLQENAKRVTRLIDVAKELLRLTDRFSLDVIGPESHDVKIPDLKSKISKLKLQNNVFVHGEKNGTKLVEHLRKADIFVFVSDIEGYPLVISEAQSFGLPIVMYELPWLAVLENNRGIRQVKQGDAAAMAAEIFQIVSDKQIYKEMSEASIKASQDYLSFDFRSIYNQLLDDELTDRFSPEISIDCAGLLLRWNGLYAASNFV